MAKLATLVSKETAKLSDAEKATIKADKAIVAILKSGDKTTLETFASRVNLVMATLNQSGDQQGKRFSGATTHGFDDQVSAYADTVIRGHIPTVA